MAELNAVLNLDTRAKKLKKNEISFTLHPAHSRVGRGTLVLKHSEFLLLILEGLAC